MTIIQKILVYYIGIPEYHVIMNTSVHIPDDLARRLENHMSSPNCELASRNAFIVEAIRQLLDEVESEGNWCEEIMAWQGCDIELQREELTGFERDLGL